MKSTRTIAASGASSRASTPEAVREACAQAESGLQGRKASLAFVFVSPDHSLQECMGMLAARVAGGTVLGCTGAGEITDKGLTHGGVALLLVASDAMSTHMAFADNVKTNPDAAAAALTQSVEQLRKQAEKQGLAYGTTVTLIDGLAGTGEVVVNELRKHLGAIHQIVGGAAGDEGRFKATWVGAGARAGAGTASAVHIFGTHPWGVGVDHGLSTASEQMRVTKASGGTLFEIDGRPAFDVYRDFAKTRGVDLKPDSASPFLINHELGVFIFGKMRKARAPLAVGTDGSLACAAEVPQGASVAILDGKEDELVQAARSAALEAQERLKGQPAAGVLLFDCICRGTILGNRFHREIEAVQGVFPGVPIAGFLTYGEIARYSGRLDGWHNTTAVVAAIPA